MKPAIPDKIAAKCPVLKLRRPTRLKDGELSDTEVDRCMQQFCKWKDSQKFVHNGYLPFSLWENDDSRFWKPVQEHGEGCCALTLAQKFPFDKEGSKHFSDMKHMPSHRHSDTKFGASVEEAGSKKHPKRYFRGAVPLKCASESSSTESASSSSASETSTGSE